MTKQETELLKLVLIYGTEDIPLTILFTRYPELKEYTTLWNLLQMSTEHRLLDRAHVINDETYVGLSEHGFALLEKLKDD